jgi:hypothetical protein
MPTIIPTGADYSAASTLSPDDIDRSHYLREKCFGLNGEEFSSCLDTYSGLWYLHKTAIVWGPMLLLALMVALLVFRHWADIENVFVNGVAGVIKGKRRMGNHFADVKSRIADKANE